MARLKDTEINGNLVVDGTGSVAGDLEVDGDVTITGSVAGDLEVDGGINVNGSINATSSTINGDIKSTGVINAVNFDGVFVTGLRFYSNKTVTLKCDGRSVIKIGLAYNNFSGYVEDIVLLNSGQIQGIVHQGTATSHLTYTFDGTTKTLTITSPSDWSYGWAIGTRFFV